VDEFTVKRITKNLGVKERLKGILRNVLGTYFDRFIVETYFAYRNLSDKRPFRHSIAILPNGINATKPYNWNSKKEDIILVVGRIGATQKNHELILNSFSRIKHLYGYKLYFVGPVEDEFKAYFNKLCNENALLKDNVLFIGNIDNKEDLYSLYKRSRIISFSSLYEGFSIAMIEALYFGCYLISTDLAVASDLTDNGRFGTLVQVNCRLIDILENDKVVDLVKYVHDHKAELINSNWFNFSVDLYSTKLQEVISPSFDISSTYDNSQRIYMDYNWSKIRTTFNSLIK
jgi:glycosyltransferase involved in cell wall biosynthesis